MTTPPRLRVLVPQRERGTGAPETGAPGRWASIISRSQRRPLRGQVLARLVPLLDGALLATTATMLLTQRTTPFVQVIFLLLTVGAFVWGPAALVSRSVTWVGLAAVHEVHAVGAGRAQPEALLELPVLTAMLVVVALIVAQRGRALAELARLAHHDPLTRLPNRLLFADRLETALGGGGDVAVLYLDLDGFKVVNDRLGHAAGDAVLVTAAERLVGTLRPTDVVARLGGDEFAVLLPGTGSVGAGVAAERVVRALREPLLLDGEAVAVSASVGVAVAERATRETLRETGSGLLRRADAAMYRAKGEGKARCAFDTPQAA